MLRLVCSNKNSRPEVHLLRRSLRAGLALVCFALLIRAETPQLKSLICNSAPLLPKGSLSCVISLTADAPPNGFVVAVTSDSAEVGLPSYVTIPEGQSTATFTATTGGAPAEEQTTIQAADSSQSVAASVSIISASTPVMLVSKSSGKCLDVTAVSLKQGAGIQQWGCSGGENQHWFFKATTAGTYEIESQDSKLALAITSSSRTGGAGIIQWAYYSNSPSETWRARQDATGYYNLIAVNSGMCLDVRGGTSATESGVAVQQWACTGAGNQAWEIVSQHWVSLHWGHSSSPETAGYFLYRATNESGPYTKLSGRLVDTEYVDGDVLAGHTYYYAATASSSNGRESGYSNRVRVVVP